MTQVKICGITNLEDALAAVEAGADFLGFILYPASKRYLTTEALREITAELKQRADCPKLVGVFVDDPAEKVADVMAVCQLDLAQLSGEEPPAVIALATNNLLCTAEATKPCAQPPWPKPKRMRNGTLSRIRLMAIQPYIWTLTTRP